MATFTHDLPDGMFEWVARTGGGEITQLYRHVARREAWVVDVTRPDGSVCEGFLRLERERVPGNPWSLAKETQIIRALRETAVPVPDVYGENDELACTLFERVPGRSDLDKIDDAVQQRRVMEHFMEVVAEMHTLDLDSIPLPPMPRPTTAAECAFGELDLLLAQWGPFVAGYRSQEPLLGYCLDWLGRFQPQQIARVSLVQGDTGPVNFMFAGDRVTSVIDWEWGHLGDPMEDLGNICVREFWNPSGGLRGLFPLYEKASGIPVSFEAARYYRVQQNVRGMIPIHYVTQNAHPRESIAWYLAYRYVGDRASAESMAESMGIAVERPEMPSADSGERDILSEAARYALDHDVAPAIGDAFARARAGDVGILVACIDRRRRYGAAIEAIERDEMGGVLGATPATVTDGFAALDAAITARTLPDETLLPYLARRAYRLEWLHAPACALYPDRRWSPLE